MGQFFFAIFMASVGIFYLVFCLLKFIIESIATAYEEKPEKPKKTRPV